jgi:hypothetical protein
MAVSSEREGRSFILQIIELDKIFGKILKRMLSNKTDL